MTTHMRWQIGRAVVVALLLAVVAAGTALASRSVLGEGDMLYARAQETSGVLRLVDNIGACRSTEKAVQWNVQGPQGLEGPQGPAGASMAFGVKEGNEVTIPTLSPWSAVG